ncbi:putative ribonuclease H-like domain-containing protein [Tanacetum coccineum]|uniref:Ribonuclease H-like domain-containing protein n=1 Tax=Tanacetum coccineum TaxID=301880 RepID=A0ABQ5BUV0_9ASTR
MKQPPLLEANYSNYWKNHFETYVKSKDIDLWHIIVYGNYKRTIKNKDTNKEEIIPYENFEETHKKMVSKNDEAKMVVYNALPKRNMKEFSCVVVLEKDSEISKNKKEKYKSLALKERKASSDEEASCLGSNDEEYAMAVRDFKNFYRIRGKFVRQPHYDKKNFQKMKEDKKEKEDRRCFKCGDTNHFISDCPKHSFNDQKVFVRGCWSNSEEDFKKDEICLMAHDNNEVFSDTSYYSSSSLDSESLQNEYNKLLNSLSLKLTSFKSSNYFLQEMIDNQRSLKDKHGLRFTEGIASTSKTKIEKLSPIDEETSTIESAVLVPSTREPASSNVGNRHSAEDSEILESNIVKRNSSVQITKKPLSNTSVRNVKQTPILKLGQGLRKGPVTTEEKAQKKNDVKARIIANMALPMNINLTFQSIQLEMLTLLGPRNQYNRNRNHDSSRRTVNAEETSSKAMVAIDGVGSQISDNSRKGVKFVSYNVVPPPPTCLFAPPTIDLSNFGLEEFQQPEFEGYGPKAKSVKQHKKPARKPVKYAEMYRSQKPRESQRNWNNLKSQQLGGDFVMYNKACFVCGIFNHVPAHCNYHQREGMGHPQKEDQGYVDSVCSRHMTGNLSYLSDFKEFDGGYELQFNLFSISQMCDKKNSVLFTNTACFVLSPYFKLPDESRVLLKVPSKNNMYSVDMKNIVPKESLTCLVAKATLDESMLWHRRLGHINFKTINKLDKDNLVRGLSAKCFENDQTCVACLKGKQHKASCKSKIQNSITQPLFMLHMDLFGLTFVSSLMNKKYCLVVTDDYSRFTWDNGTEFKNRVMNEFCEKKDIKREFSIARTPQQNGVAERRNRTLIEAARTICRTPALSFMRPFGCHVTILNTLDHLGKFDGKSDDGFFVGYSFVLVRLLEYTTLEPGNLTKSMTYVSVVAGTNSNDFAGSEESNGAGHTSKEIELPRDYIGFHCGKMVHMFDSSFKEFLVMMIPQFLSNAEKKDDEGLSKASGFSDQVSATLEATHADLFGDKTKIDMSNLTTSYQVPTTPNTRIHIDHSLDHVIGDIQSGDEPKIIAKDLSDPAWVEATQEELLQFKLQKVWILVNFPKGSDEFYGETRFLFGLQVKHREDGIFISQDKYVAEILRKFGFTYVRTAITPMDIEKPLLKESDGDNVDFHLYKSMIRSLMYLTSSRPYIMFAVCACARFQVTPKVSHSHAVKRIFRLISWQCKKQTVVATSSTKAEYVAAASCCRQVLWIQNQMLYYRGIKRGQDTKIPQSSGPPEKVDDEAIHKELGDRIERAATTASSLEAEQDSANLDFCNKHNMVAYLQKSKGSEASAITLENGDMEITATIDGKVKVVSEASIRRHLKLEDSDGINTLPTIEILEQLALMGTFTPIESDDTVSKVVVGSSKRDVEQELNQESSKRQKIREGSEPAEESKYKESGELSQEQLQQLIIIVPEEGMNVEALQTKYSIVDWEVYTEDSRKYWKIIRVGDHTEVYQFFEDMLKNFDKDDLVKLWDLVRERFSSTKPTDDKERTLWVEMKRMFEPDTDNLLEH